MDVSDDELFVGGAEDGATSMAVLAFAAAAAAAIAVVVVGA